MLAKRIKNTLTEEETTRLADIERMLNDDLAPPGETPEQRERYLRMQQFIDKALQQEQGQGQ